MKITTKQARVIKNLIAYEVFNTPEKEKESWKFADIEQRLTLDIIIKKIRKIK